MREKCWTNFGYYTGNKNENGNQNNYGNEDEDDIDALRVVHHVRVGDTHNVSSTSAVLDRRSSFLGSGRTIRPAIIAILCPSAWKVPVLTECIAFYEWRDNFSSVFWKSTEWKRPFRQKKDMRIQDGCQIYSVPRRPSVRCRLIPSSRRYKKTISNRYSLVNWMIWPGGCSEEDGRLPSSPTRSRLHRPRQRHPQRRPLSSLPDVCPVLFPTVSVLELHATLTQVYLVDDAKCYLFSQTVDFWTFV